jgi:hypothetical protein
VPDLSLLSLLFCLAALLYASVGHGGASGYLAVMALLSTPQNIARPTALTLNILVAGIAMVQFARAGHFVGKNFLPFALTSVPCAFLGGRISLPDSVYKPFLAGALCVAALRLLWKNPPEEQPVREEGVPLTPALLLGAVIGVVSGMTGVGGGIFLTPVLLFCAWTPPKQASGISAAFILVNSVAGLLGHVLQGRPFPPNLPLLALATTLGGSIGAYLGAKVLPLRALRLVLAVVLILAAVKMFLR